MQRARRICRYLTGTRDWTLKLEPWKDVDTLRVMVDWASDKVDRSTAGVAPLGGVRSSVTAGHRDHWFCRQLRQKDMPSGAGHGRTLHLCCGERTAPRIDTGFTLRQHGPGHSKMSLGRMKHVGLRFLLVKDLLKRERLTVCNVPATENPADLGTEVLDVNTHRYLCSSLVWVLRSRQWRR